MAVLNSNFDTRRLPAAFARDLWHELIGVVFEANALATDADPFFVALNAWMVDEVGIGFMKASPQSFSRSRSRIARDGMDGFILQFYTRGESQDRNGSYTARPGDLYVLDMSQPISTVTSAHSHLDLVVPRRLLAPMLDDPEACHQRVLAADLPLVNLLRDASLSYLRNLSRFSDAEAKAGLQPLLTLAAATLNGTVGEANRPSVNTALLAHVRRRVDERILQPSLTIESVLDEFGISRRSLYRLFEPLGGFQAHIRRRRLEAARQALKSKATRHLSVAEIAAAHGFASAEHFTRCFRGEFGLTPREARFHSDRRFAVEHSERPDAAWARWIADIGL